MNVQEIIDGLNEGDHNFLKYFDNDYQLLFKFLEKRGALKFLDPNNYVYQNPLLIYLQKEDKEKFAKWITHYLDDVVYENGKYYLVVNNKSELVHLFCETRNSLPTETVEAILSGEGDNDFWGDYYTESLYRDIVLELTKSNLLRLKEYIIDTLKNVQLSTDTILLEDIAREQGHPEYVTVDSESIDYIVDDKDTMNHLLENELSNTLTPELGNIHNAAYNMAYEDDLYEGVWDKLNEYFFGQGEWISRPHKYGKNIEVQFFKIEIANFEHEILQFLKDDMYNLDYYDEYIKLLRSQMDECLKVYPPDYPSARKVDKLINELFTDYI